MLTPIDINKKEFKRVVRGYKEYEVDCFLDEIAQDFAQLLSEKRELEQIIEQKDADLREYKKLEETLNNTLLLAQKTADDIRESATREAQGLLREAQIEAAEILREASAQKGSLEIEYTDLHQSLTRFKTEIRTFLQAQLDLVDQLHLPEEPVDQLHQPEKPIDQQEKDHPMNDAEISNVDENQAEENLASAEEKPVEAKESN